MGKSALNRRLKVEMFPFSYVRYLTYIERLVKPRC